MTNENAVTFSEAVSASLINKMLSNPNLPYVVAVTMLDTSTTVLYPACHYKSHSATLAYILGNLKSKHGAARMLVEIAGQCRDPHCGCGKFRFVGYVVGVQNCSFYAGVLRRGVLETVALAVMGTKYRQVSLGGKAGA